MEGHRVACLAACISALVVLGALNLASEIVPDIMRSRNRGEHYITVVDHRNIDRHTISGGQGALYHQRI
jgi:hypothetical protein